MYILSLLSFNGNLTFDGLLGFLGAVIGVFITYIVATKQIRASEKPFVEYSVASKKIRNIGAKSAINVNIFKIFLDINKRSKLHDIIFGIIDKCFPRHRLKMYGFVNRVIDPIFPAYKYADITLEKSVGTLLPNEEKNCALLPLSHAQELFLVQFENINGEAYQTILTPTNGRGDFEKFYPPKRIFFKLNTRKIWGPNGKHIKLSKRLLKAYKGI